MKSSLLEPSNERSKMNPQEKVVKEETPEKSDQEIKKKHRRMYTHNSRDSQLSIRRWYG